MQVESASQTQSRRAFLKRITLGLAGISAVAIVAGQPKPKAAGGNGLPGPGSIFEPRKEDLRSHWTQKPSRFRLR